MKKYLFFILGIILFAKSSLAQDEKELLAQIFEEDRTAIDALVLYPKETRLAILETATYPQALIKLQRIQQKTSAQFRSLIDDKSKATQQIIWDLTRYPDLVNQLVYDGSRKKKKIETILQKYPEIIHERAIDAGLNHYDLLVQIDLLNQSAIEAYQLILKEYPTNIQQALNSLIELPEVLTLLTDEIQLTILVGDLYKKEPDWLIAQSDSLHFEVNRLNEEELVAWQESLEDDPDALDNLREASEEFARENGLDDLYYQPQEDEDDDLYYYTESEEDYEQVSRVEHHYYHYPYWYGYPSWYVYPRWRPYPLWWDWGFYVRPGGVSVFIGLPSFHFTNWYFYHPHHHYYYPYLTNHFIRHTYYRPRTHNSPVRGAVYHWRDNNRSVITDDWLKNENRRVSRIREFGRFESARQDYNRRNPDRKMDQKTYLRDNSVRYPRISTPKSNTDRRSTIRKTPKPPVRTDSNRRNTRTTIRKNIPQKNNRNTSVRRIDQARDYHQRTWNRSSRPTIRARSVPRTAPKRTATPKKSGRRRNNE